MGKPVRTSLTLDGGKELARFVRELPPRLLKKALRQAVNAGATPVAKSVRKRMPTQSGLLRKSITKKVKTYKGGNAVAIVGANKSLAGEYQGRRRVPANYLHLIVGGTRPHGGHPGIDGNNAIEESVRETRATVANVMQAKLMNVLAKESAKLAAK